MFSRRASVAMVAVWLLVACDKPPKVATLSEDAESVHVGKGDPPAGAREVGPVTVTDGIYCEGEDGSYNQALIHVRNRAAKKGANYVQIMTITEPHQDDRWCYDHRFIIRGMLYAVYAGSAAPPKAEAPDEDACDPPCSPGFTCNDGACEPVCNPECGANEICRRDRTCGPAPAGSAH